MAKSKYTREQLIQILQDYNKNIGFPVPSKFKPKYGLPSSNVFYTNFGSFPNALKEAGIEITEDNKVFRQKFSNEEILKIFKRLVEENILKTGKLLLMEDFRKDNEISGSTINRHFGTLEKAYELIGINQLKYNNDLLEKDMLSKYIQLATILKKTPSGRDLDKFCKDNKEYYSSKSYNFHFGGMNKLQQLANLKPTRLGWDMTEEEMIGRLNKLSEELGITPSYEDVDICPYVPCGTTYIKLFGSFIEAIIKAGMIPRSKKEPLITPKGNKALSGYEYKFILMLEQYNIEFKKEEFYKTYIKDLKNNYRFDFTLEFDNELFFIEIFGITGNEKYDNKVKEKIQLCKDNKINLIEFYPNDIGHNSFDEIYKLLIDNVNKLKTNKKGLDII
jgi:hypothetical protein